ncbi:MAG: aminotransferase class I/II-fold pyridoxal phosphate-dependent enzyme [Planctomycetes bacterium]|nr:aminotransferase class I/II-fold pyridoxal phosphate-dependent enzyme [Planctomycetota bacterium]
MIPKPWQELFAKRREERVRQRLVRRLRSMRHMGSTRVQLGSREYVNFSCNDYLGLAGDLRIAEAAATAAGRFGWGTGASRLVTGTSTLHVKLEQEVARFRGTEAALIFGSGYQANLGVLSGLLDKGDVVLSDASNHASIVAGCKLSGATVRVFKHRDYEDLERKLAGVNARKMVVTDTLFSIDGDTADLPRIVKLCERHGALLVVDDAHANGAIGKKGRGLAEYQNVLQHVPVVVGTFSKALGSYGGFVACNEDLRDYLINESRPFIYTTSMPIALAAANIEALRIVQKDGDALRMKLTQHVKALRARLEQLGFQLTGYHHIIGIRVGHPERVSFMAEEIEKQGILTYPMRWPSVPEGMDTLRISVSAAHTEDELSRLATALRVARDRMGGKETTVLVKREAKRPTHQNLDIAEVADLDESAFASDEGAMAEPVSAVDSNRLPPAEAGLSDFVPVGGGAGDTMIQQPPGFGMDADHGVDPAELRVSSSGRLPVVDSSESGGFEALLDDVMNDAADSATSQPVPQVISEVSIEPAPSEPEPVEAGATTEATPRAEAPVETAAPPSADEAVVAPVAESPAPVSADAAPPQSAQSAQEAPPAPQADPGTQQPVETTLAEPAAEAAAALPSADETPTDELPDDPDAEPAEAGSGSAATIVPDQAATSASGETLAPEQTELPDPVIAEIEGGTRRRKREKTRRSTRNMTRRMKK